VSANTSYPERPWRVGRHVPRHIYVQLRADPSGIDPEIAVAVGPDHLAEVIAYNRGDAQPGAQAEEQRVSDQTYIDRAREAIEREMPDQPTELLDLYLLLALRKGVDISAEDVHDAWAIWRSRTKADHPAIVLFEALAVDVQHLDDEYVDAIRRAAK
jgi:hypothetical protein